jgi:hypothetical protein
MAARDVQAEAAAAREGERAGLGSCEMALQARYCSKPSDRGLRSISALKAVVVWTRNALPWSNRTFAGVESIAFKSASPV